MPITHVENKEHLTKLLSEAEDKLVVIDFYATWCGPCKAISNDILNLSNTVLDVLFLKVDVDENDSIASEYEISAMPTFAFVRNKKLVESFSGAKIEKVRELVTKHKA